MLGWLYADPDPTKNNVSPSGQAFEGLTGNESNPDKSGDPVQVFRITPDMPSAYYMPGADPGEGYNATNSQLFGSINAPPQPPATSNQGFVTDFAYTLGWEGKGKGWTIEPGTTANSIMGCFTPQMLPILSGLAKGYAVCDQYFASAPTETLPNRAFMAAATSQGHLKDRDSPYTAPTIYGALTKAGVSWKVYGYDKVPLTRSDFPDIEKAPDSNFGLFSDFQSDAAGGNLAAYSFLEPGWSGTGQNDQHPVSNVAAGEQLIRDVYYALKNGPAWAQTLLVVNYDEHGGNYDHVPPPWNATVPDNTVGELGFGFDRFGVRVPCVLVSPLIAAGTVFRAPDGGPPFDHTSVLKTVEVRFGLQPLTARDGAAADMGAVLTLATARTDDPLAGVSPPTTGATTASLAATAAPTHLQAIQAELVAELPVADAEGGAHHEMPALATSYDYDHYIKERTAAWRAQRDKR
jgi:phospholipase C